MAKIRVLIVEDSEDDALIISNELERGGFEPTYKRVDSAADLDAALQAQSWDVVLSDFSLPQFSGPAALAVCQQRGIDLPFIIISGRVGEEIAAEMMRAGAHDYVRKDNLARLAPAVSRELRAARERGGRKRAEAMMAHLACVVESCDDAIISETLQGIVLSWNAGAERIFGYTAEEMIGKSISLLDPPDYAMELRDIISEIKRGQRVNHLETMRVCKDHRVIDVSVTVSPVKEISGRIIGASVVARDISQRKQSEKERLQLIQELTDALKRVKTLSGLVPICSACKKMRNDDGYWEQVEIFIKNRSNADFTHGMCPDCMQRLYPDVMSSLARRIAGESTSTVSH